MAAYVEYDLGDGITMLVQISEEEAGGIVKASTPGGPETVKAEKNFSEAMEGVRRTALIIKGKLEELRADDVEVTFGLKTTGKVGNFAIAEVGVEANYTVKLAWKNKNAPGAKG